jgi:hypothetical protein
MGASADDSGADPLVAATGDAPRSIQGVAVGAGVTGVSAAGTASGVAVGAARARGAATGS